MSPRSSRLEHSKWVKLRVKDWFEDWAKIKQIDLGGRLLEHSSILGLRAHSQFSREKSRLTPPVGVVGVAPPVGVMNLTAPAGGLDIDSAAGKMRPPQANQRLPSQTNVRCKTRRDHPLWSKLHSLRRVHSPERSRRFPWGGSRRTRAPAASSSETWRWGNLINTEGGAGWSRRVGWAGVGSGEEVVGKTANFQNFTRNEHRLDIQHGIDFTRAPHPRHVPLERHALLVNVPNFEGQAWNENIFFEGKVPISRELDTQDWIWRLPARRGSARGWVVRCVTSGRDDSNVRRSTRTTSGKLTLVSKSGIFSPTWDLTECRIVFQGKTKV